MSVGPVRFVVLAHARSGSGWLCGLLDAHPACCCFDELFNQRFVNGGMRLAMFRGISPAMRDADPLGFLERAFDQAATAGVTHIGFKHLPLFNAAVLRQVVEDPRYRVILLTRRDRLAQYASMAIAQQADVWGRFGDQPAPSEQPRVIFDTRAFLDFCRTVEGWFAAERRQLRAAGRPLLELTYEELDAGTGLPRVLAFLGLPGCDGLDSGHQRQNTPAIAARFTNPRKALLIGRLATYRPTRKLLRVLRGIRPLRRLVD